jgi:hypothetical protein
MHQYVPYDHHGISGGISVKLSHDQTLDDFCIQHVPNFDPYRFEAIAIKLFAAKEIILTVYALDKLRQEGITYDFDKLPVKKFKISGFDIKDLFAYFQEFSFTLSSGNYELEDMEVMNK